MKHVPSASVCLCVRAFLSCAHTPALHRQRISSWLRDFRYEHETQVYPIRGNIWPIPENSLANVKEIPELLCFEDASPPHKPSAANATTGGESRHIQAQSHYPPGSLDVKCFCGRWPFSVFLQNLLLGKSLSLTLILLFLVKCMFL